MIIQLESVTAENVEAARRSLEAVAHTWDHEVAQAPARAAGSTSTCGSSNWRRRASTRSRPSSKRSASTMR